MKATLFATFVALLMVGCGGDGKLGSDSSESNQSSAATPRESNASSVEIPPAKSPEVAEVDLDDNETRNRIIAGAIDWEKLEWKSKEGEDLFYAPNQQTSYTGLAKWMYDNGQIRRLSQYKDGKRDGRWTLWYMNGQKKSERTFKEGKLDGLFTTWYSNGQKRRESTFKDGKFMTVVVWKPNGERCPVTNVVEGNGVLVSYNDDGTEFGRGTYKDGEMIAAKSSSD